MHNPDLGLTRLCRLFGKTRQAYYDQSWRNSDEQLHEAFIIDKVKTIRQHIQRIGGLQLYAMLKEELQLHNIQIGRDRFYDLLRKHNLLIKIRKRYAVTTNSNHPYYKWPDLTGNVITTAIEQLWVSNKCKLFKATHEFSNLTPQKAHLTKQPLFKKWK